MALTLAQQLTEAEEALAAADALSPAVRAALKANISTLKKKMTAGKNRKAISGDGKAFCVGDVLYTKIGFRYGGNSNFRVDRGRRGETAAPRIVAATITRISPKLDEVFWTYDEFQAKSGKLEAVGGVEQRPDRFFVSEVAAYANAHAGLAARVANAAERMVEAIEDYDSMREDMDVTFDEWAMSAGVSAEEVRYARASAMAEVNLTPTGQARLSKVE